jgi:hypothetical protein
MIFLAAPAMASSQTVCRCVLHVGVARICPRTGDTSCFDRAVGVFWKIDEWIRDPVPLDHSGLIGNLLVSNQANIMVLGERGDQTGARL